MTPWYCQYISSNAYRSFTLNLKPLNRIITIVNRAGGNEVHGAFFLKFWLTLYYKQGRGILCPRDFYLSPQRFPDLPTDLINIQYLGLEIVPEGFFSPFIVYERCLTLTLIGMSQCGFTPLIIFGFCQLNFYQKFPNIFGGEN